MPMSADIARACAPASDIAVAHAPQRVRATPVPSGWRGPRRCGPCRGASRHQPSRMAGRRDAVGRQPSRLWLGQPSWLWLGQPSRMGLGRGCGRRRPGGRLRGVLLQPVWRLRRLQSVHLRLRLGQLRPGTAAGLDRIRLSHRVREQLRPLTARRDRQSAHVGIVAASPHAAGRAGGDETTRDRCTNFLPARNPSRGGTFAADTTRHGVDALSVASAIPD